MYSIVLCIVFPIPNSFIYNFVIMKQPTIILTWNHLKKKIAAIVFYIIFCCIDTHYLKPVTTALVILIQHYSVSHEGIKLKNNKEYVIQ